MYSTQLLRLLLVALSVFSIAQAVRVDAIVAARQGHDLVKRQRASGTGASPDASTTTTTTSSTPSSSSTPPSSTTTKPTSTPPATTSSTTTSTSESSTPSSTPPTTAPPSSTSVSVSTRTTVVVTTDPAGLTSSYTSTSLSTSTPTLASQNGGGTGGMSDGTKNIIIGVVVGVGGFIILLVVGLVIWRIWGKKKQANEDDGLMDYGTAYSGPTEKSEPTGSTSGRTPFQSTLESYHAPTQVNTASNF